MLSPKPRGSPQRDFHVRAVSMSEAWLWRDRIMKTPVWTHQIWSRLILVAGVLYLVAVSPGVHPARSDQQWAPLLAAELQRAAPEHVALQRRADAVLQALLANAEPGAF